MLPTPVRSLLACTALVALAAGCGVEKSENPLSPSVAGPIAGVDISTPRIVEPAQGTRVKNSLQPIRLTVGNASTNGVRPLSYSFEVATDDTFQTKLFARSGVTPGEGTTSIVLDRLDQARTYVWRAKAEDGANSGSFVTSGFELLPPPELSAPTLVSPINDQAVGSLQPQLTVGASAKNAGVGLLTYETQVALDVAFSQLVAAGTSPETGGHIVFTTSPLSANRRHYWRSRASDGETTSPWAATQSFMTPSPAPAPPPSPAPNPGGPCNSSNPDAITSCERAKFGHMSHNDMYNYVRAVAQSLNRNGIGGGPFGILRKSSGSSCNGYSCDVVCAGQGGSQRQYDVLGDIDGAQTPGFSQIPQIRVDVCEIQ